HRHPADLLQPAAREGRHLQQLLLRREPVGGRPQGDADRDRDDLLRPEEVQARRPGRHHELRLHRQQHQARLGSAGVRRAQRRDHRAQEPPDRRARHRLPGRLLHRGRAAVERRHRRPPADDRRRGALRDRAREGELARQLHQQGARDAEAGRDARPARAEVDHGQGQRPADHAELAAGSRGSRILGGAEGARSVTIALVSTVVFFGVVITLIVTSPGWPDVKAAFFDGAIFKDSFGEIAHAFLLNIRIFLIAEALILPFALFIAVLRSLPGPVFFPLRALAIAYTDLFRGVPTILVIYILGFGAPALQLQGVPISPLFWGIVALVLVYSAYVAEVYRAGIESVHPSQEAAARSLGLSRAQSLRFVIL